MLELGLLDAEGDVDDEAEAEGLTLALGLIEGLGELTAVVITIVQEATNLFPVLQYIFLPGRVPPRGSK